MLLSRYLHGEAGINYLQSRRIGLMENSKYVVIFIAAGTDEEAQEVAKALLKTRHAACVNIVPKINSLFWWHGDLDSAQESLLIVKSKASLVSEIVGLVKEVHSYETPEIVALPIIGGNPDYLDWIGAEAKGSAQG
jgi:periplasmic divalent cation tolerance protein